MGRLFLCALVVVCLGCMTTNAVVSTIPTAFPTPTFTPVPVIENTPTLIIISTPTPKRVGFVTVTSLHVRACPNGKIIDVIHEGQEVTIRGSRTITTPNVCKVWYNVTYYTQNHNAGWTCSNYIKE